MTDLRRDLQENPHLLSHQLENDKRLEKAKQLIKEAIQEVKQALIEVRPPLKEQKEPYEKLLKEFSEIRGGSLFYPYIGSGFGNGPFVELLDGSVKYDCISGIGVHFFGHTDPKIFDALFASALSDTVMQGHLQQNSDVYAFSRLLKEVSGLDHCFLSSSGAMANENALKIAFAARPEASRILAFEKGFCGRTLTLATITDKPQNRKNLPLVLPVDYLPFFDPEEPSLSMEKCVSTLKKLLTRYPGKYAACLFELVQGEGGFYPGSQAFFSTIMEILKKEGVLIITDEIQTFGRTYQLFAYHYYKLQKYVDIVTVGKLTQACATLYRDPLTPPPGLLSQTFTASTSALKAGFTIVQELLNGQFYGEGGRIAQIHEGFVQRFSKLQKEGFPIEGPFGIGMMIAFTPFEGDPKKATALAHKLFEKGVIAFMAGQNPTRIRFLPPVNCIEEHHLDEIFTILADSFQAVQKEAL